MKFEVICDTLLPKNPISENKERNLMRFRFYCMLTKLTNFNGKIKKIKKLWLKFMKKGLKYRERRWYFYQVKNLIIMTIKGMETI